MESKLLEYRARKRKEAFIESAKEKFLNLVTFDVLPENMNTVDIPEDSALLPQDGNERSLVRAPSPYSSDTDSIDIASENLTMYSRFSRASFIIMSFILWMVVFAIFVQIEFGIIYCIVSALVGIYVNTRTGPRRPGEVSAYSVFNKNCEAIDGTLKAEQLEKQMVYGLVAMR